MSVSPAGSSSKFVASNESQITTQVKAQDLAKQENQTVLKMIQQNQESSSSSVAAQNGQGRNVSYTM